MQTNKNQIQKNGYVKKDSKVAIMQMGFALILSIAIVYFSNQICAFFGQFMYFGVFALSLLAHATVFFPTFLLQLSMISIAANLDPLLFGIFAGIGSAIGELTGYALGSGSQGLLKNQNKFAQNIIDFQNKIVKLHPEFAIFLFSLIPNPFFDFAGIFAGFAKMKWQHFIIVCALARIIRYSIIGYFGAWAIEFF